MYAVTSVIHGFMVSACILQTWIISLTNGIVLSVYTYSTVVDNKRNLDMHKIRFKEECMTCLSVMPTVNTSLTVYYMEWNNQELTCIF